MRTTILVPKPVGVEQINRIAVFELIVQAEPPIETDGVSPKLAPSIVTRAAPWKLKGIVKNSRNTEHGDVVS
jgi:hypothetical protein